MNEAQIWFNAVMAANAAIKDAEDYDEELEAAMEELMDLLPQSSLVVDAPTTTQFVSIFSDGSVLVCEDHGMDGQFDDKAEVFASLEDTQAKYVLLED